MSMDIERLRARFAEESEKADTPDALEALRVAFLGKKGEITALLRDLRDLSADAKKEAGQKINALV